MDWGLCEKSHILPQIRMHELNKYLDILLSGHQLPKKKHTIFIFIQINLYFGKEKKTNSKP